LFMPILLCLIPPCLPPSSLPFMFHSLALITTHSLTCSMGVCGTPSMLTRCQALDPCSKPASFLV
jgi:hypothetical protein